MSKMSNKTLAKAFSATIVAGGLALLTSLYCIKTAESHVPNTDVTSDKTRDERIATCTVEVALDGLKQTHALATDDAIIKLRPQFLQSCTKYTDSVTRSQLSKERMPGGTFTNITLGIMVVGGMLSIPIGLGGLAYTGINAGQAAVRRRFSAEPK